MGFSSKQPNMMISRTLCLMVLMLLVSCNSRPQKSPGPLSGLFNVALFPLKAAVSLVQATNDTAPLVLEGIQEFRDFSPLVFGFARAFLETQQEKNMEVMDTFIGSFMCDLRCNGQDNCKSDFCKTEKEVADAGNTGIQERKALK